MCIQVVSKKCDCPEGPSTQVTFMWPLICVALHVSVQVGAPWAGVATQLTLKGLLHTCRQKGRFWSIQIGTNVYYIRILYKDQSLGLTFFLNLCGLWWLHVAHNFLSVHL